MKKDIVPELLARLEQAFQEKTVSSELIIEKIKKPQAGQATYEDANAVAIEIGGILADVFSNGIQKDQLPDGRMYYNIARRILDTMLGKNHEIISGFSEDVQAVLNKKANIGIAPVQVPVNQDRIDGLVNRIASETDYDKAKWLLNEPVKKFSQSIVDENIKANADRQYKAGLRPSITRTEAGSCCDWCKAVSGVYEYPKVPKDVYRRHPYCRCTVDYDPADGKRKRQNVHTKKTAGSEEHIRAQEELNERQRKKQKADREKRIEREKRKAKITKQSRLEQKKKLIELARGSKHKKIKDKTQINNRLISSNAYKEKEYLQERLDYIDMYTNEKQFIPKMAAFSATKVIAKGDEIRVVESLIGEYGGEIIDWSKKVGKIESERYVYDVHWYECNGKQYEPKVKHKSEKK